jgi:hypothetical protein
VIGVVAATPSEITTVLSRLSPLEFLQAAMALLEYAHLLVLVTESRVAGWHLDERLPALQNLAN